MKGPSIPITSGRSGQAKRPQSLSSVFVAPTQKGRETDSGMGWLTKDGQVSREGDKIHIDVLVEARKACYRARDAFYACLEKEVDKNPTEIVSVDLLYPSDCKAARAEFISQCRSAWVSSETSNKIGSVKHFDRQYCAKKRVQGLLDSDDPRRCSIALPQRYTFKP